MAAKKIVVYGIPNCDTVKKARVWLEKQAVPFEFHDFKKAGVSTALLQDWLKDVSLDELINRRGTTWRGLSDTYKDEAGSPAGAVGLVVHQPSLIHRPGL